MHPETHIATLEQEYHCTIGIEVRDVSSNTVFFANRAHEQVTAASCIKLFVAGAVLDTLHDQGYTLDSVLRVEKSHLVPGTSVLADLALRDMSVRDLLYLLLAHSDTSAQNVLEQVANADTVQAYISSIGCTRTVYVPKYASDIEKHSRTTPYDAVRFMAGLWHKDILTREACTLILSYLAQSRHAHYGLRYLPCSINTKNPLITEHYSKAGKIHHAVNDTLLLKSPLGVLGVGVFVDNLLVTENYNSVDHDGIRLISSIVRDLFLEWSKGISKTL